MDTPPDIQSAVAAMRLPAPRHPFGGTELQPKLSFNKFGSQRTLRSAYTSFTSNTSANTSIVTTTIVPSERRSSIEKKQHKDKQSSSGLVHVRSPADSRWVWKTTVLAYLFAEKVNTAFHERIALKKLKLFFFPFMIRRFFSRMIRRRREVEKRPQPPEIQHMQHSAQMLSYLSEDLIKAEVLPLMNPQHYIKGEYLFYHGEVANAMYFVVDGVVSSVARHYAATATDALRERDKRRGSRRGSVLVRRDSLRMMKQKKDTESTKKKKNNGEIVRVNGVGGCVGELSAVKSEVRDVSALVSSESAVVFVLYRSDIFKVLSRMPYELQMRIVSDAYAKQRGRFAMMNPLTVDQLLQTVVFQGYDSSVLRQHLSKFSPEIVPTGRVLYQAGDIGGDVYFIVKGQVLCFTGMAPDARELIFASTLTLPEGCTVRCTLPQGRKMCMTGEFPVLCTDRQLENALVTVPLECYKISKEDFTNILQSCPAQFADSKGRALAYVSENFVPPIPSAGSVIQGSRILAALGTTRVEKLLKESRVRSWYRNTVVAKIGDNITHVYIVARGCVGSALGDGNLPGRRSRSASPSGSPMRRIGEAFPVDDDPNGGQQQYDKDNASLGDDLRQDSVVTGNHHRKNTEAVDSQRRGSKLRDMHRNDSSAKGERHSSPHRSISPRLRAVRVDNAGGEATTHDATDRRETLAVSETVDPPAVAIGGDWEGLLLGSWRDVWTTASFLQCYEISVVKLRHEFDQLPHDIRDRLVSQARRTMLRKSGIKDVGHGPLPPLSSFAYLQSTVTVSSGRGQPGQFSSLSRQGGTSVYGRGVGGIQSPVKEAGSSKVESSSSGLLPGDSLLSVVNTNSLTRRYLTSHQKRRGKLGSSHTSRRTSSTTVTIVDSDPAQDDEAKIRSVKYFLDFVRGRSANEVQKRQEYVRQYNAQQEKRAQPLEKAVEEQLTKLLSPTWRPDFEMTSEVSDDQRRQEVVDLAIQLFGEDPRLSAIRARHSSLQNKELIEKHEREAHRLAEARRSVALHSQMSVADFSLNADVDSFDDSSTDSFYNAQRDTILAVLEQTAVEEREVREKAVHQQQQDVRRRSLGMPQLLTTQPSTSFSSPEWDGRAPSSSSSPRRRQSHFHEDNASAASFEPFAEFRSSPARRQQQSIGIALDDESTTSAEPAMLQDVWGLDNDDDGNEKEDTDGTGDRCVKLSATGAQRNIADARVLKNNLTALVLSDLPQRGTATHLHPPATSSSERLHSAASSSRHSKALPAQHPSRGSSAGAVDAAERAPATARPTTIIASGGGVVKPPAPPQRVETELVHRPRWPSAATARHVAFGGHHSRQQPPQRGPRIEQLLSSFVESCGAISHSDKALVGAVTQSGLRQEKPLTPRTMPAPPGCTQHRAMYRMHAKFSEDLIRSVAMGVMKADGAASRQSSAASRGGRRY